MFNFNYTYANIMFHNTNETVSGLYFARKRERERKV